MLPVVIYRAGTRVHEVRFPGLPKRPVYSFRFPGDLIGRGTRYATAEEIRAANAALLEPVAIHPVEPCCHGTGVMVVAGKPEPCPCVETWEAA